MTGGEDFRDAYVVALRGYLLAAGESQLRIAYELGRTAVAEELGVLELADIHHDALAALLSTERREKDIERIARSSGDFFRESLSAFEMVQRGFREAREGTVAARRQAAMVRRLSDLLADASLSPDQADFTDELLMLIAEEARELAGGRACLVTVAAPTRAPGLAGASWDHEDADWAQLLADSAVRALAELVPPGARALRLNGEELSGNPQFHALALASPPAAAWRNWLAAPIWALDGRRLGAIQLFDKPGAGFSQSDEEVIVHLSQMTSAALERRGWAAA